MKRFLTLLLFLPFCLVPPLVLAGDIEITEEPPPGSVGAKLLKALEGPPPAPPAIVVPDDPAPAPPVPPKPDPTLNVKLNAGEVYVRRAVKPCLVTTSPLGILDVKTITPANNGIVSLYIKAPGAAGYSWQDYTEPYVYAVTAKATGTAELIITPVGATKESDIVRRMIDANNGPLPPDPIPPKPPDPPDPDPFQASDAQIRVLIVYNDDTWKTLGPAQRAAIQDDGWRKRIEKVGTWRCFSIGTDVSNSPAPFRKVFGLTRNKLPWLYIGNGKHGFNGEMPATLSDFNKLLSKFGA